MSNTATRLINLIMLLQDRPNQKAADLADELGVSVRTLHRYLGMLDEMGIPVYSERGPYGGFSLVRGYRMPPLVLSPQEAVAVSLGAGLVEELWGQLYRQAARGALAKLENLLPDEQRREAAWARRALFATGMQRADFDALAPDLDLLRRAAREHRRVRMRYQGQGQAQSQEREVDPYALVHRWGWWYMVGYCHLRRALRTFRVDRMAGLALLATTFAAPLDFDLRAYLAQDFQMQAHIKVRLRFEAQAGRAVQENRYYWDELQEGPQGEMLVTFSAPTLEWAASTALMFSPAAEVLEPPELRRMLGQWAAGIAAKYAEE